MARPHNMRMGATFYKFLTAFILVLLCLALYLFWLGFFSSRPPLTTDPAVLAGDGSELNYCELPVLDGSGKMAADIPKGNTPGCGYSHFPLPILAQCTEPLPPGADDLRGLWLGVELRSTAARLTGGVGAAVVVGRGRLRSEEEEETSRYSEIGFGL